MQRTERIVALALLAALLFNYPLLSLFARDGWVLGLPVLYVYLFGCWLLVLILTGLVLRRRRHGGVPPRQGEGKDGRHV